jgi:hypothetical protein
MVFTTVGTWQNTGHDIQIGNDTYHWSKHLNCRKLLEVPRRVGQRVELATDLESGPDYERAVAGGFKLVPAIPMSLSLDSYRQYICGSRGEFTAAKDVYVRTCEPARDGSVTAQPAIWPLDDRLSPSKPVSRNLFRPALDWWDSMTQMERWRRSGW